MKGNTTLAKDGIIMEFIKNKRNITQLMNKCLIEANLPDVWNNVMIMTGVITSFNIIDR